MLKLPFNLLSNKDGLVTRVWLLLLILETCHYLQEFCFIDFDPRLFYKDLMNFYKHTEDLISCPWIKFIKIYPLSKLLIFACYSKM